MTLLQAKVQAAKLSIKYSIWYVREVSKGNYQPYAHSSEDERTVATYTNGKEFIE